MGRYKKKPLNTIKCKCGHDHYAETGTDLEGNESIRWERLPECCSCDCESFEGVKK